MLNQKTAQAEAGIHVVSSFQNVDQAVRGMLGPMIQQAEAGDNLPGLRRMEEDIRQMVASLVRFGIYRVQWSAVRVANKTGQEKTYAEGQREQLEQDIRFARALPAEDVLDLGERAWQSLRTWLIDHEAPAEIQQLAYDLPLLMQGGVQLLNRAEMEDFLASCLADAFRRVTILLDALGAEESPFALQGNDIANWPIGEKP